MDLIAGYSVSTGGTGHFGSPFQTSRTANDCDNLEAFCAKGSVNTHVDKTQSNQSSLKRRGRMNSSIKRSILLATLFLNGCYLH